MCPFRARVLCSWPLLAACNQSIFRGFVLRRYLPRPGVAFECAGGATLFWMLPQPLWNAVLATSTVTQTFASTTRTRYCESTVDGVRFKSAW